MNRSFLALLTILALFNGWSLADEKPEMKKAKRVMSTAVKNGGVKFDDMEKIRKVRQFGYLTGLDFPILLPPYHIIDVTKEEFGSCLLYLESISIVVFASGNKISGQRDFSSASAVISGGKSDKNKFVFDETFINCFDRKNETKNMEFSFRIKVDIQEAAKAKAWNDDKTVLFSVDGDIDLTLKFKIDRASAAWNLIDLQLNKPIVVKKGDWLSKNLRVDAGKSSLNAALVNFGGFKDYNYACSSTPLIAWSVGTESHTASVGISFNNIQIQAFDIQTPQPDEETISKGLEHHRFSSSVNDCVGTFSIGSWMSIIVILVLLLGLSFGFLMLNSVQTMDRFDDPKQKQLIINAKE